MHFHLPHGTHAHMHINHVNTYPRLQKICRVLTPPADQLTTAYDAGKIRS